MRLFLKTGVTDRTVPDADIGHMRWSACTSKKLEDSEEVLEGSFAGGARTNKKKYIYILNSL